MPGRLDTKGRTRYHEPNMAHPPPSATLSDTKAWERQTWVDWMASLSKFRDHVPRDIPTPDNQQPAPSTYMTLMYNMHYTLCSTHYHAPTGHWVVHGTKDVLDQCPIGFDEILQVLDGAIPKPKEQVQQEQDVDRIDE